MVFDYIDGAAGDECTMRRNLEAFSEYDLVPHVLTGVDAVDLSVPLLGLASRLPFVLGPAAGNRLFHRDGELAVAKAAHAVGAIYTLSTLATVSIEDVAAVHPGRKWFQLYVWKDRGLVREMLSRARAAGYEALVLTVDMPITGNRERDLRNGFTIPPKTTLRHAFQALKAPWWTLDYLRGPSIRYANLTAETPAASLSSFVADQLFAGFSWKDAEWVLGEWSGPAILKGVLYGGDAVKAVSAGFSAISISNHGGRQLNSSPAPLDVLPQIASEVTGRAELILDGGIRCSTDILKALALGANAVSFARPYLYGLAAAGEMGVARVLGLLEEGLRRDMMLLGVTSPS